MDTADYWYSYRMENSRDELTLSIITLTSAHMCSTRV